MLAFLSQPSSVGALTTNTIQISETGGIITSDQVQVTGDTDAAASVRNVIRSDGSNTHVDINVRTERDGIEYATSVSRIIEGSGRVEVVVPSAEASPRVTIFSRAEESGPDTAQATTTTPFSLETVFERFSSALARMVNLVFFFW